MVPRHAWLRGMHGSVQYAPPPGCSGDLRRTLQPPRGAGAHDGRAWEPPPPPGRDAHGTLAQGTVHVRSMMLGLYRTGARRAAVCSSLPPKPGQSVCLAPKHPPHHASAVSMQADRPDRQRVYGPVELACGPA